MYSPHIEYTELREKIQKLGKIGKKNPATKLGLDYIKNQKDCLFENFIFKPFIIIKNTSTL